MPTNWRAAINVRLAQPDEKFLALDGRTYSFVERTCVIADAARAVAIGGVMGGEDTGVTDIDAQYPPGKRLFSARPAFVAPRAN